MKKILIFTKKEIVCFDVEKLSHITSSGRISTFHSGGTAVELYIKLDDVMKLLPDCYLRCHQSNIVNMNDIKVFAGNTVTLSDGTDIRISKSRYRQAKEKFLNYIKNAADNGYRAGCNLNSETED